MEKYLLFDYNIILDDEGEDCLDSVFVGMLDPQAAEDARAEQQFDKLKEGDNFQ